MGQRSGELTEGLLWELRLKLGFFTPQDVEIMAHLYADGHDPMQRAKVMKTVRKWRVAK